MSGRKSRNIKFVRHTTIRTKNQSLRRRSDGRSPLSALTTYHTTCQHNAEQWANKRYLERERLLRLASRGVSFDGGGGVASHGVEVSREELLDDSDDSETNAK